MRRKTISLITILAMMISLLGFNSFNSFSSVVLEFAGGTGTESDPWQIATAEQLDYVRYYVGPEHRDKYFSLIADIDLNIEPYNTGIGWIPIGDWFDNSIRNFQGNFDGAGHTISGLTINNPMQPGWGTADINAAGLFSETKNATIKNINLTNVNVTGSLSVGALAGFTNDTIITNVNISGTIKGEEYVGGITGYAVNSLLSEVHFIGTIEGLFTLGGIAGQIDESSIRNASSEGTVIGEEPIGGLIGEATLSSIFNSHSHSIVTGIEGSANTGGLVGTINFDSTIDRSYATGSVTGEDSIGGLVGTISQNSKISNSYATGNVSSTVDAEDTIVAGLVGTNSFGCFVMNSYATGIVSGTGWRHGGLVGFNDYGEPILSSYSLGPNNNLGTFVTEDQMKTQTTFTGWDFTSIWSNDEGVSYPELLSVVTDAEILSLQTFSQINAYIGTPLSSIELPSTVVATLNDTSIVPLIVHWDGGTPVYNGDEVNAYVFTGTLSVVEGIANPDDLNASITVNILPIAKAITAVETLSDINVTYGTPWDEITLPMNVTVTLEDSTTRVLPVEWDEDSTAEYDGNTVGIYTIIGNLTTGLGESNPSGFTASIDVVVSLPPDTPPVITSHPANIEVLVGETASFTVAYTAYPEPSFQWQISKSGGRKWANILGATSAVYDVTQATIGMTGYQYRVILQNGLGEPITSNAGLLTVTNGLADLDISQNPTLFIDSREIEWEITVTNLGPDTAHDVVIKNPLASSTKFLSYTGSYVPIFKGKSIIFNVGPMYAYDSVTVTIQVSIIRDVGLIENTATVSTTSTDEYLFNNSYTTEAFLHN